MLIQTSYLTFLPCLRKGCCKIFTQALWPIKTFTLEISNFWSIFQKLYTISVLMSYHALLYEIWVQIYISFSVKCIFTKSQNLTKKLLNLHTFECKKRYKNESFTSIWYWVLWISINKSLIRDSEMTFCFEIDRSCNDSNINWDNFSLQIDIKKNQFC